MPKIQIDLSIINNLPNPIWCAGEDGKCIFFNQAWLDFTGNTMEQEIGSGWSKGLHPEDLQKCSDEHAAAAGRRESFTLKYRLLNKDGTYHWLVDHCLPLFDGKNNLIGYIGSCYDETENKKNSEEVKKLAGLLSGAEEQINELKKETDALREENEKLKNSANSPS